MSVIDSRKRVPLLKRRWICPCEEDWKVVNMQMSRNESLPEIDPWLFQNYSNNARSVGRQSIEPYRQQKHISTGFIDFIKHQNYSSFVRGHLGMLEDWHIVRPDNWKSSCVCYARICMQSRVKRRVDNP